MASLDSPSALAHASDGEGKRQRDCTRCKRPTRVCLCPALPADLLRLAGHVLVLQHPHELKKRLATVPLLRCCLDAESLTILSGRKLHAPGDPHTDSLLEGAQRGEYPLYLLFPGTGATDLATLAEGEAHGVALQRAWSRRPAAAAGVKKLGAPAWDQAELGAAESTTAFRPTCGCREAAESEAAAAERPRLPQPASGREEAASAEGVEDPQQAAQEGNGARPVRGPDAGRELEARGSPAAVITSTPAGVVAVAGAPAGLDWDAAAARTTTGMGAGTVAAATAASAASASGAAVGGWVRAAEGAGATSLPPPAYLLLVIDGTWRQAREMFKVVQPRCLPPQGPGVQVALKLEDVLPKATRAALRHPPAAQRAATAAEQAPVPAAPAQHERGDRSEGEELGAEAAMTGGGADGAHTVGPQGPGVEEHGALQAAEEEAVGFGSGNTAAFSPAPEYDPDMPCLIRKEPGPGFVTTYEATVRALGILERDPAVAASLLQPLRLMTRLQASFSPAVMSRMRAEPEMKRRSTGK